MRFNPASHLPLSPPALQILLALADGEKHGYAIIKEIARRTDGGVRVGAGTLYAALKRFVDSGLVAESGERPDPALDDERRRYYLLTARGRAVAEAETERLAETLKYARAKLAQARAR